MVFDYIACNEYELNFEELANTIRLNSMLSCKSKNSTVFFDNWINLLRNAYEENINRLYLKETDKTQLFQKEIYLGNQKLLLHFQINVLES